MFNVQKLEQTVFSLWIDQAQSAYDQLLMDVEDEITRMRAQGISDTEILDRLKQNLADNTDGFSTFKGWMEGETDKLTHSVAQGNVNGEKAKSGTLATVFMWELDPTAQEHCVDCLRNSGAAGMTFSQWAAIGLPGAGNTVCNYYCKCALKEAA